MARQRGTRWEGQVTREGRRWRTSWATEGEAISWEARAQASLVLGQEPEMPGRAADASLTSLLERTHALYWAGTRGEDQAVANAMSVITVLGPLTKASRVDIQRLILTLKSQGNGPATINRKLAALGKMLTVAAEAGIIPVKPILPKLKEPEHRTRYLTREEQARLFSFLEEPVRSLCVFLVETGVRRGEAERLQWSDVTDRHVHIHHSKGGEPRSIPLTDRAYSALNWDLAKPWPISKNKLTYAWDKAKVLAGLEDTVPHDLRHTCASRLVQAGVDIQTVQKWLGHKNLAMTLRYAHLAPDALDQAMMKLTPFQGHSSNGSLGSSDATAGATPGR